MRGEDLRKDVCNEDGDGGASATHTATHYPIFAQQFAQLALNLHLCATQCATEILIIPFIIMK